MFDLSKMSTEQLENLKREVVKEIAKRKKPNEELVLYTHNCKGSTQYHLTNYIHWAKRVLDVDTSKINEYAFIGNFLIIGAEYKLPLGSIVVETCGQDKNIYAYRLTPTGKEKIAEAKINAMASLIETVAKEVSK